MASGWEDGREASILGRGSGFTRSGAHQREATLFFFFFLSFQLLALVPPGLSLS